VPIEGDARALIVSDSTLEDEDRLALDMRTRQSDRQSS
jgi:hypothetical protein